MNKENIELIEDLPLNPCDLWYLLLVSAKKKPAAWLSIQSEAWRVGEKPRIVNKDNIDNIENVFNKINISYKLEYRETDAGLDQPDNGRQRLNQICDIFVAQDQGSLAALINAKNTKDDIAIGTSLGYPETAVRAFASNDKLSRHDLLPEIRYSELGSFIKFMLSKDHWQAEVAVVDDWIDTLKDLSPIIYKKCRNYFQVLDSDTQKRVVQSYKTTNV